MTRPEKTEHRPEVGRSMDRFTKNLIVWGLYGIAALAFVLNYSMLADSPGAITTGRLRRTCGRCPSSAS
ncbi:hypothetical protein [Rhodococcus marinonascens]|uniref:hypothetical protein n=1 Tax=Rhodococcus marinonascens TaxID=38311 RepID=UPI0014742EDC|nr:hypothetical protein [Rhodococcus marinonascens]